MTLVCTPYTEMERINDGCMYFTDWEGCALNARLKYGSKFHVFDELIKTLCEVYTFHPHLCHCQTNALTHNLKSCKQINEGKNKCKTCARMKKWKLLRLMCYH